MINILIGILLLMSALIVLIASVGIVRFESLFARMHVVTKVSSFALLLLLIGVNLVFMSLSVLVKSLVIFHVLIFLSPVAAHVVAKVSKLMGKTEH
jgi:multicomponent Na+:H+ antiporter subunit G